MSAILAISTPEQSSTVQTVAPLPLEVPRRSVLSLRARVAAVFQEANGRDEKTAYARTKEWYRSSGGEWTRGLSERSI